MRRRRYFVGLCAVVMAVSTMIIAGPAGAIVDGCQETMNPASQGNASGLMVACTFASLTSAGTQLHITDYHDPATNPTSGAVYHYGEARNAAVTVQRVSSSTAGRNLITTCPTNTTAGLLAGTAVCPGNTSVTAPVVPAGNLAISTADVNHSIEFPTSSATMTGLFIPPGAFIKSVAGTSVTLSAGALPTALTLAGGPLCPASPGPAAGSCAHSVPGNVLISNGTNRAVTDAHTYCSAVCNGTNGTDKVTSATVHFCGGGSACASPSDIGARVSGGDLPDGATIGTITSVTEAHLICTGCSSGFTFTTDNGGSALPLTIDPKIPPSSSRYVTNGTCANGTKTLGSAVGDLTTGANPGFGARFSNSDKGMEITFNPAIAALKGARISTVAADGSTATLISPANCVTGGAYSKFTIGKPTKTAPATGDVVGQLAISLIVNPSLSPTSPPCAAAKVSGFQIELQWYNPGGYSLPAPSGTNYTTVVVARASIAQLAFITSATSFGGWVKQNYTTAASENGPSTYMVSFEFLPVGAGLCPGTGIAEELDINAIAMKTAKNPSFTGGGGGGTRALSAIPDGTFVTYSGSTGASVVTKDLTGITQFSGPNTNSCTVTSPNTIAIGCTGNIR